MGPKFHYVGVSVTVKPSSNELASNEFAYNKFLVPSISFLFFSYIGFNRILHKKEKIRKSHEIR